MEQTQKKFLRSIGELRPFFSNQSNKVINDENALYYVPFSIALKSMAIFANAHVSNYV